jgi:hypothetical protein
MKDGSIIESTFENTKFINEQYPKEESIIYPFSPAEAQQTDNQERHESPESEDNEVRNYRRPAHQ